MSGQLLFSHPNGNANVRATLVGLYQAGLLKEFHTAVATFPGNVWDRLSRLPGGSEFQRRKFDERLKPLTIEHPWREMGRITANRLGWPGLTRHETGTFCIDAVYRSMDAAVARRVKKAPKAFTGVYAYEDGALATFQAAREANICCWYDLPIGYWRAGRRLLKNELERKPEWANTLTGFKDSPEKLQRKDAELAAATKIIVASTFTANTLKEYPGQLPAPVIVPYGFPPVVAANRSPRGPITRENPLRLIFVGGLSQRKGIADLFAAVNTLDDKVALTIVGHKAVADCPALDKELSRHRWIPGLPHEKVLAEMQAHDVLVFPSLFEGFGLVITEAMSQGVPVITTERTAGPDLITHDDNGWLIEAGSQESLLQQLEKLIKKPEIIHDTGHRARETAATRPWSVYGQELAAVVIKL